MRDGVRERERAREIERGREKEGESEKGTGRESSCKVAVMHVRTT